MILDTPGSYKHIPITDPLLEEKLDIVISKWKITNQEIVQVNCQHKHSFFSAIKMYKLVKGAEDKEK